jgi:hypothetical protein
MVVGGELGGHVVPDVVGVGVAVHEQHGRRAGIALRVHGQRKTAGVDVGAARRLGGGRRTCCGAAAHGNGVSPSSRVARAERISRT